MITDIEMIARQAKQLAKLEDINTQLKACVGSAIAQMYSVGGPLNDNFLKYSEEQLKTFHQISKCLEGKEY